MMNSPGPLNGYEAPDEAPPMPGIDDYRLGNERRRSMLEAAWAKHMAPKQAPSTGNTIGPAPITAPVQSDHIPPPLPMVRQFTLGDGFQILADGMNEKTKRLQQQPQGQRSPLFGLLGMGGSSPAPLDYDF